MADIPCAVDDSTVVIPEDVSSLWKSLDPAVRAALIESESMAASNGDAAPADAVPPPSSSSSGGGGAAGVQGRRALASSGPRIESSSHIGGSSFVCRASNPGWIKVRSDVYDEVRARREEELSAKVPADIAVTLPDGNTLAEDKVRKKHRERENSYSSFLGRRAVRRLSSRRLIPVRYTVSVQNIQHTTTTENRKASGTRRGAPPPST